ncbi:Uncharacterized conserved protein YjdB, contains Ig-like domain [Lachnospiraceae bacterium RM5]|nr:Uncharacterized conserved protein YjdB, contains Ig-like domain [Lachnospiraceae bacterium RM5]
MIGVNIRYFKKVLSVLMMVMMVASVVSYVNISNTKTAMADDETIPTTFTFYDDKVVAIDGSFTTYSITGTTVKIEGEGDYYFTGSCKDGNIIVKKGTKGVTLYLDGLNLTATETAPIVCNKSTTVTIIRCANTFNYLMDSEKNNDDEYPENADAEKAVIKTKDGSHLTLDGDGYLTVSAYGKNGIKATGESTLTLQGGGYVNVFSNVNDAIAAENVLNIYSGGYGISAADVGIHSDKELNIGKYGEEDQPSFECYDAKEWIQAATVNIFGTSNMYAKCRNDGINAANKDLTDYNFEVNIYDGKIYLDAGDDAIDSNGDINIYGGDITAYSGLNSDSTPFDCDNDFNVYGGTVFGLGMSGGAKVPVNCDNYYVDSSGTPYGVDDLFEIYTNETGLTNSYTGKKNANYLFYYPYNTDDTYLYYEPYVPSIYYMVHVQTFGWEKDWLSNGETSGTVGKAKRLEGIKIKLEDYCNYSGSVEYMTHIQTYGWESQWKKDGEVSGTVGKAKRLEAIKIRLTGELADRYSVYYRVQAQKIGWLGWCQDGSAAGTAGYGYRLEAIQILLNMKNSFQYDNFINSYYDKNKIPTIGYKTQVQSSGWEKNYVTNGATSGTVGKAKRLEAIKIEIIKNPLGYSGNVEYTTHVQKQGWQKFVKNGALSGTVGKALRLEAIKIRLTGELADYLDVYYRVQAQNVGWMGWAKNGDPAGTADYGYRLEAIQIVLAYKNTPAPGSTANCYFDSKNAVG